MMSIGQFAAMTGITVKALRHYDERGLLVPVGVDDRTGYRRYSTGQIRDAMRIRAMRAAGVPIDAISASLRSGGSAAALAAHRASRLEEREAEDRAHAAAEALLDGLRREVEVERLEAPACPYASAALIEADDAAAERLLVGLAEQIAAQGAALAGTWWLEFRVRDADEPEIRICWPFAGELDAGQLGPGARIERLPDRIELIARWPMGDDDFGDGLHPAAAALMEALDGEQATGIAEVRQRQTRSATGEHQVEVIATIAERPCAGR